MTFSEKESDLGSGGKVVIQLCRTLPNPQNTIIYFDNWFTSMELICLLKNEFGINSLGTIRSNRSRGCTLEQDKAILKRGRGSYDYKVDNKKGIAVVKWADAKCVTLASSYVSYCPVTQLIQGYGRDIEKRCLTTTTSNTETSAIVCHKTFVTPEIAETQLLERGPKAIFKYTRNQQSSIVSRPVMRGADGSVCENDRDAAEVFAKNFSDVYTIEPPGPLPTLSSPRTHSTLEEIKCTEESVLYELSHLSTDSSPGPDCVTAFVLKSCRHPLLKPLLNIIQTSFESSVVPTVWLFTLVTSIYKSGDKLDPTNYRPISRLNLCQTEADLLNSDLAAVTEWSRTWLIPLNEEKCSVLHLGSNNPESPYHFPDNQRVHPVATQRDLSIIIKRDLSRSEQAASVVKRANSASYILGKSFQARDSELWIRLFKSYVRPLLEYGTVVWSPNLIKDIKLIESEKLVPRLYQDKTEQELEVTGHYIIKLKAIQKSPSTLWS
ncbi:hypothetical protein NQ318_018058 [Aromia moschata]|uniref:PiggyBac transposable element-derived protein domain-containing protein n=1 Tax=Aromia moschata TaxID=1265417 RepID=A0AAV8ZCJ3_9CUCU|nr:hypothetical protein NQ318_018058 [Aromia moschata]